MKIEEDLREFLISGRKLDYDYSKAEAGDVGLCSIEELSESSVWVAPPDGEGYFEVPAISLTNRCEDYDPGFILLWLPNERLYGAWDGDHWELTVFPNITWSDIASSPLKYINLQWYPDDTIGRSFKPVGYKLEQGLPF